MSAFGQTNAKPARIVRIMARYFFNLTNGGTVRDTDGEECLDLDSAKALAVQTAHDFARNKRTPEIAGVCLVTMLLKPTFSIDYIKVIMNLS